MSTLAKLVIGILCLMVVSCAGVAVLAAGSIGALGSIAVRTLDSDPARVNAAAARIADFELPDGWRPDSTAEIVGHLIVSYATGDGHSHLYLVQGPRNVVLDQPAVDLIMLMLGANRGQPAGTAQATIRGLSVPLAVGQGVNHDGEPFQTLTGVFTGKGGPVFVSIEMPLSTWNQPAVDGFIASIR